MLVPTMLPPNHMKELMHAFALTDTDLVDPSESVPSPACEDVSSLSWFARLLNAANWVVQFGRNVRIGPPQVVEACPSD
jgi:hypothetical protein